MAATSAQTRAFGLRVAASAGVVVLLALILLVVIAPWSSGSAIASAMFSGAAPVAGGTATLESAHLSSGQSVAGSLVVRNDGDADGHFVLGVRETSAHAAEPDDSFAERLHVVLLDVSDGPAGRELYRGSLAGLRGVDLGVIDAGAARTYRISVLCPSEMASDVAAVSGSVSVAFDWTAVAPG